MVNYFHPSISGTVVIFTSVIILLWLVDLRCLLQDSNVASSRQESRLRLSGLHSYSLVAPESQGHHRYQSVVKLSVAETEESLRNRISYERNADDEDYGATLEKLMCAFLEKEQSMIEQIPVVLRTKVVYYHCLRLI